MDGSDYRKESKEKRRKRYNESLEEEGFTGEDLTLLDWKDILSDLVEAIQHKLTDQAKEATLRSENDGMTFSTLTDVA